jgi:uncharacterized protein (DUF2252 family)
VQSLLPLRYQRMAESAFAFYRGGALIVASDLFNSPERHTVFDINDFDETLPGPWEWDVKRLAASVEVCGRSRGFTADERRDMVLACAQGYREAMRSFAKMGNLDVWYAHMDIDHLRATVDLSQIPKKDRKGAERAIEKAKHKDSNRAIAKLTEVVDGHLRVVSDPPIVVPLRQLAQNSTRLENLLEDDANMAELAGKVLTGYRLSLAPEERHLVEQYRGVDIARKVVGVGSVGARCWIVVMQGANNDDPLVLQVEEAQESVLERFVGRSVYREHGQRVVRGQRAIQMSSDMLLGWCRLPGEDGRHKDYYVRQLWDGKGSIDLERLSQERLAAYARACGWTLAHAHARTGDRFAIAAYLGKKGKFDQAIAQFADAYADQNEKDYQRFLQAIDAGEISTEIAE